MKTSTIPRGRKPSLWLTLGTTAAAVSLMFSLSACSPEEPEKGTQPSPVATESFGSDFETAKPSPSGTSSASPAPSASVPVAPTLPPGSVNSSLLPSSVSDAEKAEMDKVATDFIRAYGSLESSDKVPTQWRERAAPFTTPEYQKELEVTFPDGARLSGWEDFKKNNARQFAEISSVRVGVGKDYDSGKVTMGTSYLLSVSSDVSNGTQVLGRYNKFVELTKVDGKWKVSSIHNITGGGA